MHDTIGFVKMLMHNTHIEVHHVLLLVSLASPTRDLLQGNQDKGKKEPGWCRASSIEQKP
ncbi:hypothetical protein KDW_07160 [Dictyobacter vulcani]|uniref:Uncharacterized protein n=1 Tax=Dictyobacter vulcani TaxID=2607529 RepID=A0A5J4KCH2_9CHLR|nr:hypothetical protein KDW_07160 [Dictyobacter vulcani]